MESDNVLRIDWGGRRISRKIYGSLLVRVELVGGRGKKKTLDGREEKKS
jgi:hypothetical protein